MGSIKKILFGLMMTTMIVSVGFAQSSEDSFFYGDENVNSPTTNISTTLKNDIADANDGVLKRMLSVFNLDQFTSLSDASALEFAKYIINIALSLASFIAVIVIMYGFAQIFFSKDEEGITQARKIVQNAAIAIAIIAVSRFIVSFLFNIYERFIS